MVNVRHVRMVMCDRLVLVQMAVAALRHRIMVVGVMPIVMRVGMLMCHGLVVMLMVVSLRQVHQHPCEHQQTSHQQAQAA